MSCPSALPAIGWGGSPQQLSKSETAHFIEKEQAERIVDKMNHLSGRFLWWFDKEIRDTHPLADPVRLPDHSH